MSDIHREIQELLVDYAGALRDGCIPTFLKSLTRKEAKTIVASDQFGEATEIVRVLNSVGFASKAVTADVGLFMSRVDANIVSRMKRARGSARKKSRTNTKMTAKQHKTEKQI